MGIFREWIQNIVIFLIFITMVGQLIPDEKYKKYIRLTTGLILILVLLMPVTKLLGIDEDIYRNFIKENIRMSAIDAQMNTRLFDTNDTFSQGYKALVNEEIRVYFDENAMIVKYCYLDMNEDVDSENYGEIYGMRVGILPKDQNMEQDSGSTVASGINEVSIPEIRIGESTTIDLEDSYIPEEKIKVWKNDLTLQFGIDAEQLELEILS